MAGAVAGTDVAGIEGCPKAAIAFCRAASCKALALASRLGKATKRAAVPGSPKATKGRPDGGSEAVTEGAGTDAGGGGGAVLSGSIGGIM